MEARLLAGVVQTDTYIRLQVAEELTEYFKKEEHSPEDFPELERLIAGLGSWMSSSNSKISVGAMEILGVLVQRMKEKFKSYVPAIFPALKERLGDGKDQVRDQAQLLIQQIMRDSVTAPQAFLDRLLEVCLAHKNWRVKEQGLICLSRTLNYFGSGQVTVSRFMGSVCNLLSDANSQVRTQAVETTVEIYQHVGVKVRIDLSRRSVPSSRLAMLTARFDEIDLTSNTVPVDREDVDFEDDRESVSSCSSSASARTSTRSAGTRSRAAGRPPSSAKGASTSGAVDEASFEKAFQDVPHVNVFTAHDLERAMSGIETTLGTTKNNWEFRVTALKELRALVRLELLDHPHFVQLLKPLELPLIESLKDLRSQVTREACVTLSCMSVVLGSDISHFAEQMVPPLINLLPNSARVMANSAEICLKFIIKHIPTHRLLQPLSSLGLSSKSPVIRKHCAEFVSLAISSWDAHTLERSHHLLQEVLRKGVMDADSTARKHMRRAFWGYHAHFPSAAQKIMDTFDPQLQKLLSDEKAAMGKEKMNGASNGASNGAVHPRPNSSLRAPLKKRPPPLVTSSSVGEVPYGSSLNLQKALTSIANVHQRPSPDAPLSPTQSVGPAIRLQRPTVKSPRVRRSTEPHVHKSLRSAQSVEDLKDVSSRPPQSPIHRPPSRPGSRTGMRPPSRTGLGLTKKSSAGEVMLTGRSKVTSGGRMCRSAQPSPAVSRDSSPTGRSSLPRGLGSLTQETLLRVYGGGGSQEDEDDAGSVTSERSTFSITSEVSISPYIRFPHPITDLNELLAMTSSQQWSERRDGIAQLHMMLESSSRALTHSDIQKVKAVFKRMFAEPHIKVFAMFLDVLGHFIEEHREYLDDWLFLILLRLLHRQGTDMLSSVHYKLALVLEHVRKSFEPDQQFHQLCRILIDQTQPMNSKVKVAWLEFFHELLPVLESSDFKDVMETRQAISKLLQFTSEPRSAEIRKLSQKAITKMFGLNPATFTLMLRSVPKSQQETANRIMRGYMQEELNSSGDEAEEAPPSSPSPGRKTPTGRRTPSGGRMSSGRRTPVGHRTPGQMSRTTPSPRIAPGSRIPAPSPVHSPKASPRYRPKTPQGMTSAHFTQSLTASALRGLRDSRTVSSSTPDMSQMNGSQIPTPGRRGSRIPTPSRPSTSMSISRSGAATPTRQRRPLPPRAASVDPDAMAARNGGSASLKRPTSARSLYKASRYQNGSCEEDEVSSSSSLEMFSFSDLPNLDYGSPDEEEVEEVLHRDHIALILRELQIASTSKQRHMALQSLYTVTREHPDRCNWEEHFRTTLFKLVDTMDEDDAGVRTTSLRILREVLKTEDSRFKDYAELMALKVLKAFADSDASVSQAAEDLFGLLAPALPTACAMELLCPMALREKYPMLLGTIKLLTKVISLSETSYMESKLNDLVPGILRGYSHSESSVRKASVFCLVAIHSVVGEKVREHLSKLSSSQSKLLNLYITRQQQAAAKAAAAQQNGPKR